MNQASSLRKLAWRCGTTTLRVASSLIVRISRSTTAMLPCLPIAPYRGRIALLLHQRLNAVHQKMLALSQIKYLGVA